MRQFLIVFFCFLSTFVFAQKELKTTRILFVFDASLSMHGQMGNKSKMDVAQKVMSDALDSLKNIPNLQLAIRMYGNRVKITPQFQDCNDTHLEVPFAEDNIEDIKHLLKRTVPRGTTPIAKSLEETINDFPPCDNCRNIIILVTDGLEACDGDPCAVAKALRTHSIYLKPFVIGLGVLPDYKENFYCIGSYFDAQTQNEFKSVLNMAIEEALNTTSAQINLLDIHGKPTETNVAFTLYDKKSGNIKYDYIHTLNYNNLPDTLTIDPTVTYDIKVHTLPPVFAENITLKMGTHNTIPIETPQGSLNFTTKGGIIQLQDVIATVYLPQNCERVNIQKVTSPEKYIVGSYDIEIATLPPIKASVEIQQSKITNFEIPQPGNLAIKAMYKGYGGIYHLVNGKLELVKNLDPEQLNQNYKLQPGDYKVIYRSKNGNRTFYSVEKDFTISSGKSTLINL